MKAKIAILISILVLLTGAFGVAAQDTFFGHSAEDLFPIPKSPRPNSSRPSPLKPCWRRTSPTAMNWAKARP